MAEGTAIEWTDDSWNPIRARNLATGVVGHYCVKISPGCKNCYAERLQGWPIGSGNRYAAQDRDKVEIFLDEKVLLEPLSRRRGRQIFPCSMTDLFGEFVPDEWIGKIFDVMYRAKQHTFQITTKRAERMVDFIAGQYGQGLANSWAFENVWFGFSAEDQEQWNARAKHVAPMHLHGFKTWASCEPLLTDIDIGEHRLGWAVIGGESGPGARPTVIGHVRALMRQFQQAKIPVFVKQLGAQAVNREGVRHPLKDRKGGLMTEWPEDLRVREQPARA